MSKCGFCKIIGHKIRQCNSPEIAVIIATQQDFCYEAPLIAFLQICNTVKLQVIMISYGISNVTSPTNFEKRRMIRDEWLLTHPLVMNIPNHLYRPYQVLPNPNPNPVGRLYHNNNDAHKLQMIDIANMLYTDVCVNVFHITLVPDQYLRFEEMMRILSVQIISRLSSANSLWICDAIFIMNHIFKKFRIPRGGIYNAFRHFFSRCITIEYSRINQIRFASAQAQAYIPHKPAFACVEVCFVEVCENVEDKDYSCGICAEEYTHLTVPTLNCAHTLCCECIAGQIKARTKSCIKCPFCREEVVKVSVGDLEIMDQISTVLAEEISFNN